MDYLLRFLFYLLKKIVTYGLVIGLLLTAFFMAMNMANIYIVIKDGMEMRANAYVTRDAEKQAELIKFFTQGFLDRDSLLKDKKYEPYHISQLEVKIEIEWLWNLPWDENASVTVVQRIPVIKGTAVDDTANSEVPVQEPNRYQVSLKKMPNTTDGASTWRITDVTFIERVVDPEPTERPTPDPNRTPRPVVTPTPAVTATASPIPTPHPEAE